MILVEMTRLPEIANPQRKFYPSDLSDAEWAVLKPMLPTPPGFSRQLHDQVRQRLPQELSRTEQSTVAIADAQSVKTTEKRGKSTVLMVEKR